ncbi:MAG: sigma-54-dependent Fis family transcriptional regulator [Planctomycetes bacterium]|nr:sigma-54-dependent Fis family transcriptional regulator [Planctomycetota bacterium]
MSEEKILLVDDEPALLDVVAEVLERDGYEVATAEGWRKAEELAKHTDFDLFVLDFKMPEVDGLQLMERLRRITPTAEAMIITGHASVSQGVEAIKRGARDYLTKPVERSELLHRVRSIMERRRLRLSLKQRESELKDKYSFREIIGASRSIDEIREMALKATSIRTSVLIQGESGTGKELVARAIHYASGQSEGPFIAVNCGAISPNIAEREFFGHEKGSFTGAHEMKTGYFEAAGNGTLFLDEIGELPLDLQVKLLRVLDNNEIMRVGGNSPIKVNPRMLFATNRDLEDMVEKRSFRKDLYYRINVINITVPPLRERREDIPLLAVEFIRRNTKNMGIPPKVITEEALIALEDYDWPGNARELQNAIERSVALCRGAEIRLEHLPGWLIDNRHEEDSSPPTTDFMAARRQAQERFDKRFITKALDDTYGNVSQAAKNIGIARSALQRFMRKYGIERNGNDS